MLDIHPSVVRNRDPILTVLRRALPPEARVLEVASGSGAHAAWFTTHVPGLSWQPSEHSAVRRSTIQQRRRDAPRPGFLAPIALDAASPKDWPTGRYDAVVNINMTHISPWEATCGLLQGASTVLVGGGLLVLYGPFSVGGQHTAPSNARFDRSLRAQDPRWGVRDVGDLVTEGRGAGLRLREQVPMPANNFVLIFEKSRDAV